MLHLVWGPWCSLPKGGLHASLWSYTVLPGHRCHSHLQLNTCGCSVKITLTSACSEVQPLSALCMQQIKRYWYLKNEVTVSCAVRGHFCCSLVFWSLFAASGEINYIYKGSTCSFGVASSVFGSSITSGFIRSTLKPWHKPATTSWKPGNSCLLAMRCLSVSSSVVTYIQLITGWKQAWTSKLWLQCFFVCCGFLFFYYFPWNQNTRPFWCRTAWFELWAERAHQACEWSLRCAEARKLLDRFGGDAPPCREAIK